MKRSTLNLILFLSLAVNIALAAYEGARFYQTRHRSHEDVMADRQDTFANLLPAKAQDDLKQNLDAQKDAIRHHMNAQKRLRIRIRHLLEQDPVDATALTSAFAEMRYEHDRMQRIYQNAFVDAATKLDVETRKHVTRTLHQRHGGDDKD